mmetsp:Transcript_22768/g.28170  ORF Transcript_22768/g.28170 Transcript_22768/m.28170 type:complete len:216 (-) Transcript_22768:1967-2614(-)
MHVRFICFSFVYSHDAAQVLQLHARDHADVVLLHNRGHKLGERLLAHLVQPVDLVSQWRVRFQRVFTRLILAVKEARVATVGGQRTQVDILTRFLAGTDRVAGARGHQLGSGGRLLLLNALVVLNLAVVARAAVYLVTLPSRFRTQVIVTEVVRHARVLLGGHIAADTSYVVQGTLVGAGTATQVRRRLQELVDVLRGVAMYRLRSTMIAGRALA